MPTFLAHAAERVVQPVPRVRTIRVVNATIRLDFIRGARLKRPFDAFFEQRNVPLTHRLNVHVMFYNIQGQNSRRM
jgi:hypothetical protein